MLKKNQIKKKKHNPALENLIQSATVPKVHVLARFSPSDFQTSNSASETHRECTKNYCTAAATLCVTWVLSYMESHLCSHLQVFITEQSNESPFNSKVKCFHNSSFKIHMEQSFRSQRLKRAYLFVSQKILKPELFKSDNQWDSASFSFRRHICLVSWFETFTFFRPTLHSVS